MSGTWQGEGTIILDEGKRTIEYLEEITIAPVKPPVVYNYV